MAIDEQGRAGEKLVMDLLTASNVPYKFQPDAIYKEKGDKGGWVLVECKNQERFKAPPFDGHGLPPYQVRSRLKFYRETGVRCLFFVHEPDTNMIWWQWLDVLDALDESKKFLTKNGGRIVFKLSEFYQMNLPGMTNTAQRG